MLKRHLRGRCCYYFHTMDKGEQGAKTLRMPTAVNGMSLDFHWHRPSQGV